jgi:hypothetical protein
MFRVENSVVIDLPAGEVFAFVADPRNDPSWYTDVVEVAQTGGDGAGVGATFRWVMELFGRKDVDLTISAYEPDRRVELEAVWGPRTGVFDYVVEPSGEGTRLTRVVEVKSCNMPLFGPPIMRGVLQRREAAFLRNLEALLEGRAPSPVPVPEEMLPDEAQDPSGAF